MDLKAQLRKIREAKGKVLIIGLGISGVETARFLLSLEITPLCIEKQSEQTYFEKSKLSKEVRALIADGAQVQFGVDGEKVAQYLAGVSLAVLSPGVPLESAIVGAIQRAGIKWISELELGVVLHGGPTIVVTGSNGKSTTVSLIQRMLELSKIPSYLCGNVGVPVISNQELLGSQALDSSPSKTVLVVEASSYQLEACNLLKPQVSVLLNVSENHLERHGTIERYAAAKARMLQFQDSNDLAVLNIDDPMVREISKSCRATVACIATKDESELQKASKNFVAVLSNEERVIVNLNSTRDEYRTKNTKLLGKHNRFNIGVAAISARFMGATPQAIQEAIDSFTPLEHRVELLKTGSPVLVINDSKATTVAASVASFMTVRESYPKRLVTLLIGGLSKAGSWDPLLKIVSQHKEHVTPVVCFGKDGPLLASHCRAKGIDHVVSPNLKDATKTAKDLANQEGVVLLAPGCASFDEFSDFEQRGTRFKEFAQEVFR